jgi:N-acetylglucosamine kinase-like BadF-type ATPase
VHYRRVREQRLGELAPAVVAAAACGDAVAGRLVERLAEEIVLLAMKALQDLGLAEQAVDVVLGGGMLQGGSGFLYDRVVSWLGERAPAARSVNAADPPVIGATLAALDAVGAPDAARQRLRAAMREGVRPEVVA